MKVITLAEVKVQLGLESDTTYDTQISAKIPIIDAKVKAICRNQFNEHFYGIVESGNQYINITSRCPLDELPVGTKISGSGIPAGAYISETFYDSWSSDTLSIPSIELSEEPTETDSTTYLTAGINIAYLDHIAKGIMWMINKTNTTVKDNAWISKSMSPLSVTKSDRDNRIDNTYGMPAWFVKGLPRYHG